jgi:xanthine/CO dehydrogenase XdhC/CoxF family maturation factor
MASKQELAEYVGALASELSRMCRTQRLDVLAQLLQMVTLEATELTTRQTGNQKSGK